MLNAEVVSFAAAPAARISLCLKPDRGDTPIHHVARLKTPLPSSWPQRPLVPKERPTVGEDDEAIQLGHRAMYHRRPLLRRQ